jgi:hypothetical protein
VSRDWLVRERGGVELQILGVSTAVLRVLSVAAILCHVVRRVLRSFQSEICDEVLRSGLKLMWEPGEALAQWLVVASSLVA